MNRTKVQLTSTLIAMASPFLLAQEAEPTLKEAITEGKAGGNVRFRFETADQDGRESADALTGRIRLNYVTQAWNGLTAGIEFEHTEVPSENSYNAAGVTGDPAKSIIADPPSTELNQAYLGYTRGGSGGKVGRQNIVIHNARFIGDVGWRQNDQTFDALSFTSTSIPGAKIEAGYIEGVQRIFGSESEGAQNSFDSESFYVHIVTTDLPVKLGAQVISLDLENAAALSSETYGGYIAGKAPLTEDLSLAYYGEIAFQSDNGDNPADFDAMYLHGTGTLTTGGIGFILGYEVLGADDIGGGDYAAFKTPLATLHKFNGWADVFLNTPDTGLQDLYVGITGKLPGGIVAKAFYHDFSSDEESIDYGDEIDLLLVKGLPLGKLIAKYANYSADEFGVDTERFSFEYTFPF